MSKAVKFESEVNPEVLVNLISYDHETGELTWRVNKNYNNSWNTKHSGKPALSCKQKDGYLVGNLMKVRVYSHRVAWALYYGRWPSDEIDHINRDRSDNRIENLREANRSENTSNKSKKSGTYSSLKGVTWHSRDKHWMAQIMKGRVKIYLGRFDNEEEAHDAYVRASIRLHGEFSST